MIADVNERTQRMNALIRKAEEDCAGLCEECGGTAGGPRWVNNWVRTVCQACYDRWLEEDVEHLKEVNKAGRRRSLNTTRMYFNLMDVKERERRGFGDIRVTVAEEAHQIGQHVPRVTDDREAAQGKVVGERNKYGGLFGRQIVQFRAKFAPGFAIQ